MTSLLRRFCRPSTDRTLSDADLMIEAKAALGILDFELFRAAWRNWYGAEPDDRRLEPTFVSYLFTARLPGYVRHFTRRVLAAAVAGELDPAAFGVERHMAQAPVTDLSDRFAATSLACALLVILVLAL